MINISSSNWNIPQHTLNITLFNSEYIIVLKLDHSSHKLAGVNGNVHYVKINNRRSQSSALKTCPNFIPAE